MDFNRSATSLAALKLFLIFPTRSRCLHQPRPSSRCICPPRIITPLGAAPMRACAGPEPGSNMPHSTRRVCRARRMRDANGNAAQTGGLARQVRQRMNRLGKPEHRARFCRRAEAIPDTIENPKFGRALTAAHGTISSKRLCGRSRFPGLCLPLALPGVNPQSKNPFGIHPF